MWFYIALKHFFSIFQDDFHSVLWFGLWQWRLLCCSCLVFLCPHVFYCKFCLEICCLHIYVLISPINFGNEISPINFGNVFFSGSFSKNEDPVFILSRLNGCRSECQAPLSLVHNPGISCLSANHHLLAHCSFGQMTHSIYTIKEL